jgi:hypothetical protein
MKIFVTGGLSQDRPDDQIYALGKAIVSSGHILLQGYYNPFDRVIAEAAFESAKDNPHFTDPRFAVQSFITKDAEVPKQAQWLVRKLQIRDWNPAEERWSMPEPIQACDVAIIMGGGDKTLRAAHLCRLAKKPIVPITVLKGAAIEVFETELSRFSEVYEGRVSRDQYCLLDTQNPVDVTLFMNEAIQIASRLAMGNSAFIVMAFREESEDTFSAIKDVCDELGFKWSRTDQDPTTNRIYQRIVNGIQRATLVVVDVSIPTLNVYYELGYAEALGKPIIVIAKEGTELPFDTRDIPTIMFRNQTRLKAALTERLNGLFGSNANG